MKVTPNEYAILSDAAMARCVDNAAVYGLSLSRYAEQQGFSTVADMVKWEATVIRYGGELSPNARLVVRQ